jgi:mannitol/fructose-specific phosphotransferase system IIA component (Ntr-type)
VWLWCDAVFAANVTCKLPLGCWRICIAVTTFTGARIADATCSSLMNRSRFLKRLPESPSPVAEGRGSELRSMQHNGTLEMELADSLADYTDQTVIVPSLREQDSPGIIKELSHVLHAQGCVPDVLTFYNAVLNHEFLVNSVTESGIALPHARMNGIARPHFAFGRSCEPIVWGRKGSKPVQLIFLFAVPATDAAAFLQILAALAKMGRQSETLDALRTHESALDIYELLKQVKLRQR